MFTHLLAFPFFISLLLLVANEISAVPVDGISPVTHPIFDAVKAAQTSTGNGTASTTQRQGLTPQPDGRGTLDIIWSCGFTLVLWSILCINVPAPGDSRLKIYARKFFLSLVCLIGPESIFQIAITQWESARRSVKVFHVSGYKCQAVGDEACVLRRHGRIHLADKGLGSFPDRRKAAPLSGGSELCRLPKLSKRDIQDNNKVNGLFALSPCARHFGCRRPLR
ncbi:hypothetical protein VTO42DRAFT_7223 [Malbranchea cinnamomea]